MTTLSNAPLVDAVFEVRWGQLKKNGQEISLKFSREEEDFLAGQFRDALRSQGFGFVEPIQGVEFNFPHEPRNRFRRAKDQWPCYQLGLGILAVNQVNDGYDWDTFQDDIIFGISVLDDVFPGNLGKLEILGTELRYRDGFLFSEGETPSSFLSSKFNFNFSLPENILQKLDCSGEQQKYRMTCSSKIERPKGNLIITLMDAVINGKKGMLLDTIFRSIDDDKIESNRDSFKNWINEAHDIHRVVFKDMINPAYAESFK